MKGLRTELENQRRSEPRSISQKSLPFVCLVLVIVAPLWIRSSVLLGNGSSPLANLTAGMQSRSWAPFTTKNIIPVLAQGGVTGNILPFGFKGVWDGTSKRAYYLGGDHNCAGGLSRQVYLDDATNTWVDQGLTPFAACHGYDHLSINNATETLYFWPYDSTFSANLSFSKYPAATSGPWTSVGKFTMKGQTNVAHGSHWYDGPIKGVGQQGALMLYNCGNSGGEIVLYSPETNSLVLDAKGFGGTGTYHCFASYSKVLNVGIFGGGNANGHNVWRLNPDKTVTAMPNSPVGLGVQQGNVAPDPLTGKFIVWGSGRLYEYDPTGAGTWTQLDSPPPNTVGDPAIPESVISIPIPTYGVIMYATCRATTCRVDIYKHGVINGSTIVPAMTMISPSAEGGTTGDTAPSNAVTATPLSDSTRSEPADYATRCNAAGVVRCVGFDDPHDIAGQWGENSGIKSGAATPVLDTAVKASGNSSLKFTIPSQSGADTSGSYFTNFSSDLLTQFGENTDLYIQWRQRFSPEFLSTNYEGSDGWKQVIIGTGDQPGQLFASCTNTEIVVENMYERGFAQMYNSCSGSKSHGPYDPFQERFGAYDFKLQNARSSCLYSQGKTNPSSFLPPKGNCLGYFPNEWMTFQVHIKIGPRVGDEFVNSRVELWIAREGRPSELAIKWGPYNLSAGPESERQRFGKIWLLPYNTNKNSNQTTPTAYTWYDELIISRQRVADPK